MRLDGKLVARVGATTCSQYEIERVFIIYGQSTDLCGRLFQRSRDVSCFASISVQGEGVKGSGRQLDRVPFQDEGSLSSISQA